MVARRLPPRRSQAVHRDEDEFETDIMDLIDDEPPNVPSSNAVPHEGFSLDSIRRVDSPMSVMMPTAPSGRGHFGRPHRAIAAARNVNGAFVDHLTQLQEEFQLPGLLLPDGRTAPPSATAAAAERKELVPMPPSAPRLDAPHHARAMSPGLPLGSSASPEPVEQEAATPITSTDSSAAASPSAAPIIGLPSVPQAPIAGALEQLSRAELLHYAASLTALVKTYTTVSAASSGAQSSNSTSSGEKVEKGEATPPSLNTTINNFVGGSFFSGGGSIRQIGGFGFRGSVSSNYRGAPGGRGMVVNASGVPGTAAAGHPLADDTQSMASFRIMPVERDFLSMSTTSLLNLPAVQTQRQVQAVIEQNVVNEINDYTIVGHLGAGAFGSVDLALRSTGEIRAVKSIPRRALLQRGEKTVRREIAIMKQLRHKNVVALYEVLDDPALDRLFLVMQYVSNGPLVRIDDATETCEPISLDDAKRVFRELISGLHYLHLHRVMHRDIKPDNILINDDGTPCLADFGISAVLPQGASGKGYAMGGNDAVVMAGDVRPTRPLEGTASFLAPEVFYYAGIVQPVVSVSSSSIGSSVDSALPDSPRRAPSSVNVMVGSPASARRRNPLSARGGTGTARPSAIVEEMPATPLRDPDLRAVDVWALGVSMYYAVCGRAPFRGATQAERGHSICHDTVEYPLHIPAEWQDLLNRVLEKNPMRRATLAQLKKHPVFVGGSLAEYQDSEMSPNGSSMGSSWDAPSSDGSTQPSTPRDGLVASPLIVSEAQVNDSIKPVTSGGDFGGGHAGRRVTFYGQMFRKTGSAFAADTAPRAFAMAHGSGISRESPEPLGLRHGMSNTFSAPDRAGAAARTAFHQQQPAVPPPGMLPPVRRTSLTSMASIAVPMPIPTLPSLSASPHRVTGMAMAMPPVAAASAAAGSATSRPSYQQPTAGTDSALPPLRPSSGGVTRRPHLASLAVR